MSDRFYQNLDHLCSASCDTYICQKRKESKEYKELKVELDRLSAAIEEKLGEEYKLMRRLEETMNRATSMEWKWTYHRGYGDCIKFLKWSELL